VPDKIAKITIVAGRALYGQQVQEQLLAAGVQGTFNLYDGGFSSFVTGPELALFLAD